MDSSSVAKALHKMDMTPQERDKLAKSFQDPKFMELFEDFAKEVSDPQAKAEMDAYLAQLEAEGQAEAAYGKGVQLIVPQPCFVVKTKDIRGTNRVYINICTSAKVDKMERKVDMSPDKSRMGANITLPMVLHSKHAKTGKAPDGGPLLVWDLAVHPEATDAAASDRTVLATLVEMAIERVEEVHGSKLLREYKLPKLKYKGVAGEQQPSVMAVRTGGGGEVVDGRLRPMTEAQPAGAAGLTEDTAGTDSSAKSDQPSISRSSFSFSSKSKTVGGPNGQQQYAPAADPLEAGYRHGCGAITPSWTLTERCRPDLGQAWRDTGRGLHPASNTPEALVVRVQLPGVESAAALQLDVESDRLHLEVPGKYLLDLQLKQKVLEQHGQAKFTTAKQQLTLTLPVAQQEAVQQQQQLPTVLQQATGQQQQQEHEVAEVAVASSSSSGDPIEAEQLPKTGASEDATAVVTVKPQAPLTEGLSASTQLCKTSNELRWEQMHGALDSKVRQHDQQAQQQREVQQHTCNEAPAASNKQQAAAAEQQAQPCVGFLKPRLLSRQVNAADLD